MSDSLLSLTRRSPRTGPFEVRNRRGRTRRREDHTRSLFGAVAQWFADREQLPLFVLDCTGSVIVMNVSARDILGATPSLTLKGARLEFVSRSDQAALEQALSQCQGRSALTARLESLEMAATVTAIGRGQVHLAALQIQRLRGCDYRYRVIQSMFRLTAAETDIALRIYAGSSLVLIARARNASVNTVKTQVRHLYQKCACRSLNALVRRLSHIVPTGVD